MSAGNPDLSTGGRGLPPWLRCPGEVPDATSAGFLSLLTVPPGDFGHTLRKPARSLSLSLSHVRVKPSFSLPAQRAGLSKRERTPTPVTGCREGSPFLPEQCWRLDGSCCPQGCREEQHCIMGERLDQDSDVGCGPMLTSLIAFSPLNKLQASTSCWCRRDGLRDLQGIVSCWSEILDIL